MTRLATRKFGKSRVSCFDVLCRLRSVVTFDGTNKQTNRYKFDKSGPMSFDLLLILNRKMLFVHWDWQFDVHSSYMRRWSHDNKKILESSMWGKCTPECQPRCMCSKTQNVKIYSKYFLNSHKMQCSKKWHLVTMLRQNVKSSGLALYLTVNNFHWPLRRA